VFLIPPPKTAANNIPQSVHPYRVREESE